MTLLAIGSALFGLLMAWLVVRHKQGPAGRAQALLFLVGGVLAGVYIFTTDRAMRAETLFEAMVEGSNGVAAGEPAPVRELVFEVEHHDVEHSLLIAPRSEALEAPQGEVELQFTLLGPDGELILEDQSLYSVRGGNQRTRRNWQSKTFPFRPQSIGPHTLNLVILTTDIPEVHIRVADPLKTDGERIPGF